MDIPNMTMPMLNSTTMMMMNTGMHMSFYWGKDVVILFKDWPNNNLAMYILALFFIFILSLILELLSIISEAKLTGPTPITGGLTHVSVHALRMALAYLVMLSVMSYNVGVFIVAVAGHAFGHFIVKLHAKD